MTKLTRGDWAVIRQCCTSGWCVDHRRGLNPEKDPGRPNLGEKPLNTLQMENLSKDSAEEVARNWSSYGAVAILMSEVPAVVRR